ncbi:hypothetical protein BDQ12DRAFT_722536 [Crucibulum laeve]|uniref:Uncharacterized protein n=1 Tax=Crucibulum laeve TaxID=68775 RepID=A0A5C3M315_9AGAR|nr:hypothetical protein BDQ12DRAFT_722536 [Crucibulum laeve]
MNYPYNEQQRILDSPPLPSGASFIPPPNLRHHQSPPGHRNSAQRPYRFALETNRRHTYPPERTENDSLSAYSDPLLNRESHVPSSFPSIHPINGITYDSNLNPPRAPHLDSVPLPYSIPTPILHTILTGGGYRRFPSPTGHSSPYQATNAIINQDSPYYSNVPAYHFIIRFSNNRRDERNFKLLTFLASSSITVHDVLAATRITIGGREVKRIERGIDDPFISRFQPLGEVGELRVDNTGAWWWTGFAVDHDGVWELKIF